MKKILLMGLNHTATESWIRSWMNGFGPVRNVEFVRDGNAQAPVAIIEMDITAGQATFVVSRIQSYWHDGAQVSAHLLLH